MARKANPTVKCIRCGRTLRSEASVARGFGPTCAAKIAKARVDAKAATVDKARELIELAALVPVKGRRVFRVVSSKGDQTYLTAARNCTCPAGLKGRECYHMAAVRLLAA
jgi:hypothetical protein